MPTAYEVFRDASGVGQKPAASSIPVVLASDGVAAPSTQLPAALDGAGNLKVAEQNAALAEDNTNGVIATANKPLAVATYANSQAFNAQLATNVIVKASAGVVRRVQGYLDAAIGAGTFYVCVLNEVSAVNGTRNLLRAPRKIVVPAVPVDMPFDLDFDDRGVFASTGIVIAVSTTGGNALGTVNLTLATANMLVESVRYK